MGSPDEFVTNAVDYARDLIQRDGALRGDVAVLATAVDELAKALRDAYGCLSWQVYGIEDAEAKREGVLRTLDRLRPLVPPSDSGR